MAKQDELSSTERLLELIRSEGPPAEESPHPRESGARMGENLLRAIPFGRSSISVGVDLGHEDLKLVKASRSSERRIDLLDWARIPFDPDIPRSHPDFPKFLRQALLRFLAPHRVVDLWASIPSAQVETRYLKVPRVPQKQLANTVYWTYRKQSPFDDKETLFDFHVLGEAEEAGARRIAVMALVAPKDTIEETRQLFARAGFPLAGISIVPFAIQNLMQAGRIPAYGGAVASLYIGRDWSRIDLFTGNRLVLSRGVRAGIRTMVEALQHEIEQNWFELSLTKSPTSDPERIRAIKSRLRQEVEAAQALFFPPIYGKPGAENRSEKPSEKTLAVREERIYRMILPALERLVRQMERTFRNFALNFDNARVEKVYVSSGVRPHPSLIDYIGDELGLPVELLNPLREDEGLRFLKPPPASPEEQSALAPALGMALSSNQTTPNFLYTYKDRERETRVRALNRAVFGVFFLLMLCGAGFAFWQDNELRAKELERLRLQNQLASFDVRVDKNLILNLAGKIRAQHQGIAGAGAHFLGLALLGELANVTPEQVRLIAVSAKWENPPARPAAPGGKPPAPKKVLVVEGVVRGERADLEAELAAYLMALKNSPLFRQASISRKALDVVDNQPVMRFTAQMEVV
ncbi:MAG: hypothetical protein WHT06_05225 [Desulfobacterales bacterium]